MSTQPVSSRLIRKERNKMLHQSVVFGVTAVVIVAVFVLAILPNFARIIDFVLNTDTTTVATSTEPQIIQPPLLSAPATATNSAQLRVAGSTLSDTKVTVVLNGTQLDSVSPASDGTFSVPVTLQDGDNTLSAFSTTGSGTESKASKEYSVFYDREKPLLTVTSPADKTTFSAKEQLVTLTGTTDPDSKISVNDRFVYPKADGTFTTQYSLSSGENILLIQAVDQAGNVTSSTLTLTYHP